jgi:hypothetical protein
MPEYLSNKKRKQSIGINSYSEYTDTTKIIGNVLVGFGSIGVGTTIPTQDVDVQTIRVRDTLYDYTNSGGEFGYYLTKDTDGIKWVAVPPIDSNAIFVAKNNNIVGVSSFTGLNFIADDLVGVTTNLINSNFADITISQRWIKSGDTGIYTTRNVGIGTTIPTTDFQVGFGTTGVTIDGSVGIVSALGYYGNYAFIGAITANEQLNVIGFGTTSVAAILGSSGGITTTGGDLYVGGTLFSDKLDIINLNVVNIKAAGITTLNVGIVSTFSVTGVSTLGITSTKDLFVDANLKVSGITTLGITSTKDLFVDANLEVSGITTLGITSTKDLFVDANLEVSGITTTKDLFVDDNLEVSGITTLGITSTKDLFVDENLYVVGIATATRFSTGEIGSAINITSNTISGPTELIIDPAAVGDNSGVVRIKGDLYVDGEEFIVNSTTIELADFNVGIASTVGTNLLLDGAGIGIGSTNIRKTLTYDYSSDSLKSSENFDLGTGKVYKINETEVLSSTLLTVANIKATGVSTLGFATIGQLYVSGVSTFVGVGTFINDLYVGGDLYVADDTFFDDLNAKNANITGITTLNVGIVSTFRVTGVSTLGVTSTKDLFVDANLRVTGITTLGVTTISQLNVSGITTLGITSISQLNVSGITTLGITSISQLNVSGITTLGVTSTTNLTSQQLNVSGITTLGVTSTTNLTSQQLQVTGITTLGVTTISQLYVSGVSTFVGVGTFSGNLYVGGDLYVSDDLVFDEFTARNANITGITTLNVGIVSSLTVTGITTLGVTTISQLNVSGITTLGITSTKDLFVDANLKVSGITTLGVTSTTNLTSQQLRVTGITTLGVTSTTNLTSQQLNVTGITTLASIVGTSLSISGISTIANFLMTPVGTGVTVGGIGVTYYGDGRNLTNVVSTSGIATYADRAGIATYATSSGIATYATNAGIATYATNAGIATYATNAGIATYATSSGIATYATSSGIATYATNAGIATYATSSGIATYATSSGIATYATNAGIATYATNAGVSTYATNSGIATYATSSGIATYATNAGIATYATNAGISTYATSSGIATYATSSGIATYATNAGIATYATNAGISTYATSSGIATYATNAGISTYATNAGIATYADISTNLKGGNVGNVPYQSNPNITSFVTNPGVSGKVLIFNGSVPVWGDVSAATGAFGGISIQDESTPTGTSGNITTLNFVGNNISATATLGVNGISTITVADYVSNAGISTYATSSGIATYSTNAGIATYANSSGIATYADNAGISSVATKLQISRTISLTGDVAGSVSFDGSDNVSIAATIQPNSVSLGDDTTGDYVQSITGTDNQISVSVTSGEGSTPTLSIPNQFTAPQDVTVSRDLQINRNLNVTGNITVGGTTAFINVQQLRVNDPDIVLGFRTDAFGNDVSNDTTANHGGIAIASTEGNPLVSIYNPGIGESTLPTYKKFMWFKAGTFAGLGTDAWLSNYAIGIGSTQFPSATVLAAGNIQFTQNDLAVIRNINASGIITANTFVGQLDGTSSYSTNSGIATYATSSGIATYATSSGIATYATSSGIATYSTNSGIATYATSSGIATYSTNSGIATYATSSGIATYATSSGIATYATSSGIATYSTNSGIATYATSSGIATYATSSGIATYSTNSGIATYATSSGIATYADTAGVSTTSGYSTLAGIATYADTAGVSTIATNVIGGIASVTSLNVSGITTLGTVQVSSGIITASSGIVTYYGDGSYLTGVSAFSVQQQDITSSPVYPTFASNTDVSSLGIAVTQVAYIPASGNLGIGTTTPTSKLTVVGDVLVSGVLTATRLYSGIYGEFVGGSISGSDIVGTSLSITGISTLGTVKISSGIITAITGVVTYYGDGSKLTNVVASSGYADTAGFSTTSGYADVAGVSTYATSSGIATYATNAGISTYATSSGIATYATAAGIATYATAAGIATYATAAGIATYATNAGIATYATSSGIATYATSSGIATYATNAGIATYATSSGIATYATSSGIATYATAAGIATYATNAGIATYATSSGIATYATNAGIATYATSSGIATYATAAGIATYATNAGIATYATAAGIATYATSSGIATYATTAGIATYATTAGVSTSVIGGIGSITQLQVTGISTFSNGPVFIGAATSTGTASQRLQVTGGAYVSGNLGIGTTNPIQPVQIGFGTNVVVVDSMGDIGIGTTNPTSKLHVIGDSNITGVSTLGTVQISSGIITATSGIVTYYGDGSKLSGVIAGASAVSISTNTTNQSQFIPYATSTGSVAGFGVTTTGLVFNPSTTRLGIGTTSPRATLHVRNDLLVSTGTTASYDIAIKATTSDSGTLSFEDPDSTKQYFSINKDTSTLLSINKSNFEPAFLVNAAGNVGIGTTNPTQKLWVDGNGYFTGILTANRIFSSTYGEFVGGSISGTSLVGTALSVSGISTLGTVQISSGIITATSGIVTYYGDGSKLSNVGVSISTNTTNQSQFIPYVTTTGTTAGFGVTTSGLVFNPSTTRLGIGTTSPRATLHVRNDLLVSTGTTASYDIAIKATTSDSGTLSFEDPDSTKQYFSINKDTSTLFAINKSNYEPAIIVNSAGNLGIGTTNPSSGQLQVATGPVIIGAATSTGTASQRLQVTGGAYVSGNLGIGTTNPTSKLHVIGDSNITGVSTLGTVQISSGIVTATSGIVTYYGDGSKLSNIISGVSISTNTTNQSQFIPYAISTGSTAGFGVTTSGLVFNPSTTRLGIGTTSPRATLHVRNDLLVSTGTTASYDIAIKATTSDSGTLSFEDPDSTKQYFSINKDTSTLFAINKSNYEPAIIVGAAGSVGIGTTNPTSTLHVVGDVRVGINTSQGVILTSPNGTKYRLLVSDAGTLSTVLVV